MDGLSVRLAALMLVVATAQGAHVARADEPAPVRSRAANEIDELPAPELERADGRTPTLDAVTAMILNAIAYHRNRIAERRAVVLAVGTLTVDKVQPTWHRRLFGPDEPGFASGFTPGPFIRSQVDDGVLEHIATMDNLLILDVSGTAVTDRGVAKLRSLHRLLRLDLNTTKIGDEALRCLAGMPDLEQLLISRTGVTDRGASSLKACRKMEMLWLFNTGVSDEGLRTIADLPKLRLLIADNTTVGDAAVHSLSKLRELTILSLSGTQASDKGVESLEKMTGLQWLQIDDTRISRDGFARLSRSLPKARISWRPADR